MKKIKRSKVSSFYKKLIYGLTALFIVVTIFFIWGEIFDLNISEKINHEKFSSYFTSVGALLTGFSLFFIYLQLNESKKQNDFSIQPALFIESKILKIKDVGGNSITKSYINIDAEDHNLQNDALGVKIINVGNGTALKIEAEWIFDLKTVMGLTEKYYRSINWNYKFHKDYMRTNEKLYIGLPLVYLNLFGIKMHPKHNTREKVEFPNKPDLTVKLKYIDLQHKPYDKVFSVRTESDTIFIHFDFEENIED